MARNRGKGARIGNGLRDLMSSPGDSYQLIRKEFESDERYDDRAVAIVYAAYVESALESALTTHFVGGSEQAAKIFSFRPGDDGLISTFAAKIALGEALGVFNARMSHDLRLIKAIRNTFAHSRIDVSFATEAISSACLELDMPISSVDFGDRSLDLAKPRQRYVGVTFTIVCYLKQQSPKPLRYKEAGPGFYPYAP